MKTYIWVGCVLLGLMHNAVAATYTISNMDIISGSYVTYDNSGTAIVNPSSGSTVTTLSIGLNTNLVDGYIGSLASATWWGGTVGIYTAASNVGDVNTPTSSIIGGGVPSGLLDDTANTITVDLSSFFANWGGYDFNQGTGKDDGSTSILAAGTWDNVTGAYSLSWDTIVDPAVCGGFGPNCTATWSLAGSASPVPLPGAVWLFGSGLIGLISAAKRKKA